MVAINKPYPNKPRNLKVYSKALHFMDEIYDVVERFPVYEMYGISNQLRRSVSSIGANVAEGNKSIYYSQEFRYLDMALSSTSEVRSFLDMSLLRNYITDREHQILDQKAEEIVKMLIGLMRAIERSITENKQKSGG